MLNKNALISLLKAIYTIKKHLPVTHITPFPLSWQSLKAFVSCTASHTKSWSQKPLLVQLLALLCKSSSKFDLDMPWFALCMSSWFACRACLRCNLEARDVTPFKRWWATSESAGLCSIDFFFADWVMGSGGDRFLDWYSVMSENLQPCSIRSSASYFVSPKAN